MLLALAGLVWRGFERLNSRVDRLETRLDGRMDGLDAKVEAGFTRLDGKIDRLAEQLVHVASDAAVAKALAERRIAV
jgi:hypothetical protein